MGNRRMEHHQFCVSTTPPIVSKEIVVETWKQHVGGIGVIQSLSASITTIGMEMVVAPNIDVVRKEILTRFVAKLGSGLGGVLVVRNLSQSLALLIVNIGVVGILQMVFTNSITTIHVNKTVNQPLMSSMVARGCKSANAMHSKGGYQEPIVITTPILDHKDDHYVRPNIVAFKYLDFKKDVDLDVHVRVFNFAIKKNVKTFEEYIINAFSYMLRDTTLHWCHNYMSKFPNCIFLELTHAFCNCHQKTHNDKQIYIELKNMK